MGSWCGSESPLRCSRCLVGASRIRASGIPCSPPDSRAPCSVGRLSPPPRAHALYSRGSRLPPASPLQCRAAAAPAPQTVQVQGIDRASGTRHPATAAHPARGYGERWLTVRPAAGRRAELVADTPGRIPASARRPHRATPSTSTVKSTPPAWGRRASDWRAEHQHQPRYGALHRQLLRGRQRQWMTGPTSTPDASRPMTAGSHAHDSRPQPGHDDLMSIATAPQPNRAPAHPRANERNGVNGTPDHVDLSPGTFGQAPASSSTTATSASAAFLRLVHHRQRHQQHRGRNLIYRIPLSELNAGGTISISYSPRRRSAALMPLRAGRWPTMVRLRTPAPRTRVWEWPDSAGGHALTAA